MDEKTFDFINQVDSQSDVLIRLARTGYFNSDSALSVQEGVRAYKSILLSSLVTSVVLTAVMTPLDLVVFSQLQASIYGPANQKTGFLRVARDVFSTKGIGNICLMVSAASLVRNLFVITGIYGFDNHHRNKRFNE